MKKWTLLLTGFCCCTFIACGDVEKQAQTRLQAARQAYEAGQYSEAKSLIDSIRILYPKAYDTRRKGIYLMQDVEMAEQQKTLAYLDSCLQVRQTQLEEMKPRFVLEKDTAYQQIGHYLAPTQVIEKNLHRSFLRFQTDERGTTSLTSIYCGSGNIHHTAVKVCAPDGTFTQTPPSKDSYETTDLGEKIEKADYKQGEDGGVIDFVALHKNENLRVEYLGDRRYATTMMPADRKAAAEVNALGKVLADITGIKAQMDEARQKIRFIEENMKRRKTTNIQ